MARRVKFALEMKDGFQARNNIEEIRDNFDYGKMVGYLADGRLQRWLEDRGYEQEATEVSKLQADEADLKEKICDILKVDITDAHNSEPVLNESLRNRLEKVKQYTADKEILDNISKVATNQEELLELVQGGESEIYLCAESFVIPLVVENVTYIGIASPTVVIRSSTPVEFAESNIVFRNVKFDDEYVKICEENNEPTEEVVDEDDEEKDNGEELFLQALEYEDTDTEKYVQLLKEAAMLGNERAPFKIGFYYENKEENIELAKHWYENAIQVGDTVGLVRMGHICRDEEDYKNAEKYYKEAADKGDDYGMYYLGIFYEYYEYDEKKGVKWYKKAAEKDNDDAMVKMGRYCKKQEKYQEAMSWLKKAADKENAEAYNLIGIMYTNGEGVKADPRMAFEWFEKSAEGGYDWGIYNLAQCYENGDGVTKDWDKAWDLYTEATEKGNQSAKKWLNRSMLTSNAIAEILGVIVHGKLKNGEKIWNVSCSDYGSRLIKYEDISGLLAGDGNDDLIGLKSPWIIEQMDKYDEGVLGCAYEANFIDAWEYIFFSENAVYFQGADGTQYRRGYAGIANVELPSAYEMVFISDDGERWEIPSAGEWNEKLGLENLRLFLLIMAKVKGESDYEFNDYEIGKLKMIKLDTFNGESIMDVFDLE